MSTSIDPQIFAAFPNQDANAPAVVPSEIADRRQPEVPVFGEPGFPDRRQNSSRNNPGNERRQFGNTHHGLSPAARELAEAIDGYKLQHRRRYVTYEEMLQVITKLGYVKQ